MNELAPIEVLADAQVAGPADNRGGDGALTIIEPIRGWRSLDLKELWKYRELLWVLTARDVKVRYKQTVLGFAWAIIQPVMLMIVFSIFFGGLAKIPSDGHPYPVFVYAGLLPWTFFANAINASANSVLGSNQLISKVYFPRLIVPLSSVGGSLVDFAISAGVLLALMLLYGVPWGVQLLVAPLLIAGAAFIAVGVGTLLSALTVAYRDFRYIVPFMVQFWMFATPVVYPSSLVPAEWRWLLYFNPMAGIIDGFRSACLGLPFNLPGMALSFVVALALFLIGVGYFEKVERSFADII